jgi:hypothetical protein
MGEKKSDVPLPENETVTSEKIVRLVPIHRTGVVREGDMT